MSQLPTPMPDEGESTPLGDVQQSKADETLEVELETKRDDDLDDRQIHFICSTPTEDRDGDVVEPDGLKLDALRDNPVFLWRHGEIMIPIGRLDEVWVEGRQMHAIVAFPLQPDEVEGNEVLREHAEFADMVYQLYRMEMLHAVSIGFRADDLTEVDEREGGGFRFRQAEVIELSGVVLPSNPDATAVRREWSRKARELDGDTRKRLEGYLEAIKATDFPTEGDDQTVTLANSQYDTPPLDEILEIQEEYPDIWGAGGNIKGDDQHAILTTIRQDHSGAAQTDDQREALRDREAWAARHAEDFRLAGVVAQWKWHVVGSRGLDHQREVIEQAKQDVDEGRELAIKADPDELDEGDFVAWGTGGDNTRDARGRIEEIHTSGTFDAPDSSFEFDASESNPAYEIRVFVPEDDGWTPTDQIVGHRADVLEIIDPLPRPDGSERATHTPYTKTHDEETHMDDTDTKGGMRHNETDRKRMKIMREDALRQAARLDKMLDDEGEGMGLAEMDMMPDDLSGRMTDSMDDDKSVEPDETDQFDPDEQATIEGLFEAKAQRLERMRTMLEESGGDLREDQADQMMEMLGRDLHAVKMLKSMVHEAYDGDEEGDHLRSFEKAIADDVAREIVGILRSKQAALEDAMDMLGAGEGELNTDIEDGLADYLSHDLRRSKTIADVAGVEGQVEHLGPVLDDGMDDETRDAPETRDKMTPEFQDLPLAARDREWDSEAAIGRWREFSGSTEEPSVEYRENFFYVDEDEADEFGAYKLPYGDVVDETHVAVPRGIFAAAAALSGARGGVDIPDDEREAVIGHVERYYEKMRDAFEDDSIQSPFDSERSVDQWAARAFRDGWLDGDTFERTTGLDPSRADSLLDDPDEDTTDEQVYNLQF